MKLISNWRHWWRLYSVWLILALTGMASTSVYIDQLCDVYGIPLWARMSATALVAMAGVAARLLVQNRDASHEASE